MSIFSRRTYRGFFVLSLAGFFTACADSPQSDVKISLETSAFNTQVGIQDWNGFNPDFSNSGLVKNRSCYLIHVVADDLYNPNDVDSGDGTCESDPSLPKVRGLGRFFGPVAYGKDIKVRIPAGKQRSFHLVGFINPDPNDINCSKAFEIRPSTGSGGKVDLFYGGVELSDDTSLPDPYGRLAWFQANTTPVDLGPGAQTVALAKISLGSDGLKPYPCDRDDQSPYPNIVFPIWGGYEEDRPANQVNNCTSPLPSDTRFSCVPMPFRKGPVRLECPKDVTHIKMETMTSSGQSVAASPAETSQCDLYGKAGFTLKFEDISASSHTPIAASTPPAFISANRIFRFTPMKGAVADTEHSWVAIPSFSKPYEPIVKYDLSAGGSDYHRPLDTRTAGHTFEKFVGYSKMADGSRTLYSHYNRTGGPDVLVRKDAIGDTPVVPNLWRRPFIAAGDPTTIFDSSTVALYGATLAKIPNFGFFPLLFESGSPAKFNILGANFLGSSGCPGASTWCEITQPTTTPTTELASDNGYLASTELGTSPYSLKMVVGVPNPTRTSLSWSTTPYVIDSSLLSISTDTVRRISLDASSDKHMALVEYYADPTPSSDPRAKVLRCDAAFVAASWTDCDLVTIQVSGSEEVLSSAIIAPKTKERWIVSIVKESTEYKIRKTPIYKEDGSKATGSEALPTDSPILDSSYTGFSPTLGELAVGSDKIQEIKFLRSNFYPDAGLAGQQLLLSMRYGAAGAPYSLLYRSFDGGQNWYLAQVENELTHFIDAIAVHKRSYWTEDGVSKTQDSPDFSIMTENQIWTPMSGGSSGF